LAEPGPGPDVASEEVEVVVEREGDRIPVGDALREEASDEFLGISRDRDLDLSSERDSFDMKFRVCDSSSSVDFEMPLTRITVS